MKDLDEVEDGKVTIVGDRLARNDTRRAARCRSAS